MEWGKGQGSQGSWTPNLPSDLYSLVLRVGSALGMNGRKELCLRGDEEERGSCYKSHLMVENY